MAIRILILQYRLFHYRVDLFSRMREMAIERGWDLQVVAGQPFGKEKLKKDEGRLDWVVKVTNRYFPVTEKKDLCWQPVPRHLRNPDIVVFMQENRLLSNYWWIFRRAILRGPRVAYWGTDSTSRPARRVGCANAGRRGRSVGWIGGSPTRR